MRARSLFHALRRNTAAEEGVALMEVVMSAAVLMLVVLGVLAAMDAVSGTAGANQARTVSAALAEQDQERMRGLATEDLEEIERNPPAPRQVLVGTVTYTVTSQTQWVTDAAGEEASCALESGEGSYLKITSTVTSPATGAAVPPVVLHSIVAPRPGSGTLAAKVENAAGEPVTGLTVSAAGPEVPGPEETNDVGCAVFTGLDAGTYNVTINQSPWVGEDGQTLTVKTATVTAGNVSTVEFVYDRGSSFNVEVYTQKGATQPADNSYGVIAANSGVTAGFRQIETTTPRSTFAFASMFPFTSGYTVYSGTCTGNDPSKVIPSYFEDNPSLVMRLNPGVPGGTVRVLEPWLDVDVTRNGNDVSGARVYLYPLPRTTPRECGERLELTTSTSTTNSTGNLPPSRVIGHPFGQYEICAQASVSGNNRHTILAVSNNTPAGKTVPIALPGTSNGSCPPT
jgi:hypothetical protein